MFGGDGATLLVPPERKDAVCAELSALKGLSEKRFGLGLRVGAMTVAEAESGGTPIEVARFELAGGRSIAIFRGGGLAAAEKKIKADEMRFGVAATQGGLANLEELSCRWNAVPASHGCSLSLLVTARHSDSAGIYRKVLAGIDRIVAHGLDAANPIQRMAMSYRSWWECVRDEARQFPSIWSVAFVSKLLGISVAVLSLHYGVPPFFYDPKAYANSIPSHSDYRKFDDTLRLIMDCEPAQVTELRAFLEDLRAKGEIFYGLHEAHSSLITCYVRSTEPGKHIHFVDGGDGGYAMAAKEMKAQIKAA